MKKAHPTQYVKPTLWYLSKCCIASLLLAFYGLSAYTQGKSKTDFKIDSISNLLKTDRSDTTKILHLNALAWVYKGNNPDTSIIITELALQLSTDVLNSSDAQQKKSVKQSAERSQAQAYANMGVFYYLLGDFQKSI